MTVIQIQCFTVCKKSFMGTFTQHMALFTHRVNGELVEMNRSVVAAGTWLCGFFFFCCCLGKKARRWVIALTRAACFCCAWMRRQYPSFSVAREREQVSALSILHSGRVENYTRATLQARVDKCKGQILCKNTFCELSQTTMCPSEKSMFSIFSLFNFSKTACTENTLFRKLAYCDVTTRATTSCQLSGARWRLCPLQSTYWSLKVQPRFSRKLNAVGWL